MFVLYSRRASTRQIANDYDYGILNEGMVFILHQPTKLTVVYVELHHFPES